MSSLFLLSEVLPASLLSELLPDALFSAPLSVPLPDSLFSESLPAALFFSLLSAALLSPVLDLASGFEPESAFSASISSKSVTSITSASAFLDNSEALTLFTRLSTAVLSISLELLSDIFSLLQLSF